MDWGEKRVSGEKNPHSLEKLEELIAYYQPGVIVLEDYEARLSRRSARIRTLGKKIRELAVSTKVTVASFSRENVRRAFLADGEGTKQALAEMLALRFPEELGNRLPPKRRPWMSEDCRMFIFEAVALALIPQSKKGTPHELEFEP